MEQVGLLGLLEQQKICGELLMETVPGWQTEIMGPSSPHRMELPGIIGLLLLGQQKNSMKLSTKTVPSWHLVIVEPSAPHRMEQLGITGLQVPQIISQVAPTEIVYS